jgi:hypothetical protein
MSSKRVKPRRCSRCARRMRNGTAEWTVAVDIERDDVASIADVICPDCTTAEEAVEVGVNDALMQAHRTSDGRLRIWPKVGR